MHLITEAYRRAYMDRSDYLGDPDYNDIPTAAAHRQALRRRLARHHPG
jgi:gamma-glutamyltranspeptidase